MPRLPADLSPIARWQPVPRPASPPHSSHAFFYSPNMTSADDVAAMRAMIWANQFPENRSACERVLLLYDDALTTGLGYTSHLISRALLIAVRTHRVLMAVPDRAARWCARTPYTLNCVYEPWTHCPPPPELGDIYAPTLNLSKVNMHGAKWSHRESWHPDMIGNVTRISTSQARTGQCVGRRARRLAPARAPPTRRLPSRRCTRSRGSAVSTRNGRRMPRRTSCSSGHAGGCARRCGARCARAGCCPVGSAWRTYASRPRRGACCHRPSTGPAGALTRARARRVRVSGRSAGTRSRR